MGTRTPTRQDGDVYLADEQCPCRPCYNVVDDGAFGVVNVKGKLVETWRPNPVCFTRKAQGCPLPLPVAEHNVQGRECSRCCAEFAHVAPDGSVFNRTVDAHHAGWKAHELRTAPVRHQYGALGKAVPA